MLIAAISDIHDHTVNLALILEEIRERNCSRIVCMGDICEPSTLHELIESTRGIPVDIAYGNNDEAYGLQMVASKAAHITLQGSVGKLTSGNFKLAFTHYPHHAGKLAASGMYDAVLYGHDHRAAVSRIGSCILANPGEVVGNRSGKSSYGILDTEAKTFTIHPLTFHP